MMDNYGTISRLNEKSLRDYWTILLKRKWIILAFALPVLVIVTAYSFITRPTYTAEGSLLMEKEPNILTFEEIFQIDSLSQDYYQTQHKLLESRSLIENTIDNLKLYQKDILATISKDNDSAEISTSVTQSQAIDWFLKRLDINPVKNTRLVQVIFKHHDPNFSAQAVNCLLDTFVEMDIETKHEAAEQAQSFLTDQITSLRNNIEKKEKELQEYGAEKNIIGLSDKETYILEKLGELNRALTEAQIDRVRKETYYNEIKLTSPDFLPEALRNPLIQRLREEYVKLKREYTKKEETFLPEYPEMQRLKAELETARNSLTSETQTLIKAAYSDYQAAIKREKSLEMAFNAQKDETIKLNNDAILYNSLKIEVENQKNLLESLLKRHGETGVSASLKVLKTSNVHIIDRAQVPISPSNPKKKLNILLALLLGFFGGTGLAFLFDYIDPSVRSNEDVELCTGWHSLGIIPTFKSSELKRKNSEKEPSPPLVLKSRGLSHDFIENERVPSEDEIDSIELIAHYLPESHFSEHYRTVRTALLVNTANGNLRSIIISSPLAKEGKTATLSNLAVTFAQTQKSVLVVDADLRKPKIHRIFEVNNDIGLSNYLTGRLDLKGIQRLIKNTQVPNLDVLAAGSIPSKPVELLSSEKMTDLIESVLECYDYVFFDTPPLLAVSDALVLESKCDGLILTVRGAKTSREILRRTKEKLDLHKVEIVGVILNNMKLLENGYYYMR